jgi:hypothetical protein
MVVVVVVGVVEVVEVVAVGAVARIQALIPVALKGQCELSHLYCDEVELEACILLAQFLLHFLHDAAAVSPVGCHVVEVEEGEVCWKNKSYVRILKCMFTFLCT